MTTRCGRILMQAGSLITAKEAERRVLILENPGMQGQTCITHSLFAGLQLILPGEVAPAHRHAQSALRFIIEGQRRLYRRRRRTHADAAWRFRLDAKLDLARPRQRHRPADGLAGRAGYPDRAAARRQLHGTGQCRQPVGDASGRRQPGPLWGQHAAGGLAADGKSSPVFNYPYDRTREALATLAHNGEPDPCHGYKLRYVNPATGGSPMPTIGAFMQLLPGGFGSRHIVAPTGPCSSWSKARARL